MEREMRGFSCCGECIHYSVKKHRCKICKNIETDPRAKFYDDCPLPKVAEVKHERWDSSDSYVFADGSIAIRCTGCGCALHEEEFSKYNWNFCPVCGAKMEG